MVSATAAIIASEVELSSGSASLTTAISWLLDSRSIAPLLLICAAMAAAASSARPGNSAGRLLSSRVWIVVITSAICWFRRCRLRPSSSPSSARAQISMARNSSTVPSIPSAVKTAALASSLSAAAITELIGEITAILLRSLGRSAISAKLLSTVLVLISVPPRATSRAIPSCTDSGREK